MRRALLLALLAGGCVDNIGATLKVQVADGIADRVDLGKDATNLSVEPGGEGHELERTFAFPAGVDALGFDLLLLGGGNVTTGHGRALALAPPTDAAADYAGLDVTILLAPDDAPALLQELPPDLGDGTCVSADEAGRVFVVGGLLNQQSGYATNDKYEVIGLNDINALNGEAVGACSAIAGAVAVGGCGDSVNNIVDLRIDDVALVSVGVDVCGLAVAKSKEDYWVVSTNSVRLFAAGGGLIDEAAGLVLPAVNAIEADGDGSAYAHVVDNTVLLITRDRLVPEVIRNVDCIGRRFDDVVGLSQTQLFVGPDFGVARNDFDLGGVPRGVTVLSDETIVALVGDDLVFVDGDNNVTKVALPTTRLHVSAIPGDTLLLAGGAAGVDTYALPPPHALKLP